MKTPIYKRLITGLLCLSMIFVAPPPRKAKALGVIEGLCVGIVVIAVGGTIYYVIKQCIKDMNKPRCPNCGAIRKPGDKKCPKCGEPYPAQDPQGAFAPPNPQTNFVCQLQVSTDGKTWTSAASVPNEAPGAWQYPMPDIMSFQSQQQFEDWKTAQGVSNQDVHQLTEEGAGGFVRYVEIYQ